ncbi:DUF1684 domain-containing protein [Paeniglutamicibacter psychrophenolicus]|uniref:Uncharacterized protein (DUF1684 family) n=1 Tax=Paeniglutamicibacter psychrophenolicus TaxID=257454 RepID=A0ABS4WA33_9MICC|nr:DUF1684 domain-containing protein [Paeniglutamicibacter psychrophenolicus]MBP2373069.1 uncharacterized protein (DUF1684 family) [Paeniglutamicibacter psychrophenolicus]
MTVPTLAPIVPDEREAAGFAADWRSWHQHRLQSLSAPNGFLAATALHWVTGEATRFEGLPGQWWVHDDWLYVDLAKSESLLFNGATVTGGQRLGSIAEREGFDVGHGETTIEVAKRGGRYILRPRHPQNPLLQDFNGVPAYAPDARWRVGGTFRRFAEPRPTRVGAAVKGIEHTYRAPGEVVFELDGATHVLTAFNGHTDGSLDILFTDATSGRTTYASSRSLHLEAPGPDGSVVLDFNRAVNLPCAFTDLATCPLPPAGNLLKIAVEAGEKIPYERSAS